MDPKFRKFEYVKLANTSKWTVSNINLGCLHPVACVRSGDGSFYPSTQRCVDR
jgi:hypothetical protein